MKTLKNTKQHLFKMKTCAKWIVCLLIIAVSTTMVNAQQEPTYTQYMFNTQTVNPAYAGTWEAMGFMVLAREQWTGFDGAPSTQTLTFQTLNKSGRVGLGFNVINDKVGLEKRLSVFADYSYKVKLDDELNLRLGMKFGFSNYSNNLSEYDLIDRNDPKFQGEIENKFMPNFGMGAFLYKDKYYFGASVPKLIQNSFESNNSNFSTQAEIRHFYIMGGYVFNFGENLQFKPTMLTKIVSGAPVQFDFTGNFLIAERFWLGGMLRTGDSFGFLAQWIINKKFRVGYAVDFPTTELRGYQNGTHEIMISYEIKSMKEKVISPRYF